MTSVLSVPSSLTSSNSHFRTVNNSVPPSPSIQSHPSATSSSSSLSKYSLEGGDEENVTITGSTLGLSKSPTSPKALGKQKSRSQEDLRILAISTHITELSYAISDIQTRIFEIQELRHKSQSQNATGEPNSPLNNTDNVTSIIDKSLMALDERLESVEKGIKSVNENMQPYLPVPATPLTATQASVAVTPTATNMNGSSSSSSNDTTAALIRKHSALVVEWESVQDESDVLREELKEDKWLTVFRTVTDQADGMMSSLEKAVTRCQDFIFQVHQQKRSGLSGGDDLFGSSSMSKTAITLETFGSLLESYEAKKKHYMPATSKVLSIIDRGVRDRVTKNGETLRRHSESAQRWKTLRDRIARTDTELENVRKILLAADAAESETGSSTSGYLATPPSATRQLSGGSERGSEKSGGTLSRSISPFRKLARRITGSNNGRPNISNPSVVTPLSVNKKLKTPASEPPPSSSSSSNFHTISQTFRKQRTSLFTGAKAPEPVTPDRSGHKYSQSSATPDSSPRINKPDDNSRAYFASVSASTAGRSLSSLTTGILPPNLAGRPTWNSSTNVNGSAAEKRTPGGTTRGTPSRASSRPPSSTGMYGGYNGVGDIPPVPPLMVGTPGRRSLSRASMSSSRPWSPIGSSNSTTYSSSQFHGPPPPLSFSSTMSGSSSRFNTPSRVSSRPPSRAQTPSSSAVFGSTMTPRPRPKTPSSIPTPARSPGRSVSVGNKADMFSGMPMAGDWSPNSTDNRPFSPAFSSTGSISGGTPGAHPPRPPSRSMIPVPTVHISGSSPGGRSRPSSSMSHIGYGRAGAESPTMRMLSNGMSSMSPFKASARRAQTPDMFMMRRTTRPPTSISRLPPSSFRDGVGSVSAANSTGSGSVYASPNSRPGSRSGLYDANIGASTATLTGPLHEYIVGNSKDPLDVEVGRIVNGVPHGLKVERVDPPLKKAPKEGEEVKAQYTFSNVLGSKTVTLRLTTMTRATKVKAGEQGVAKDTVKMVMTKKVMCRVGGGWQDLSLYILNRQAGL
ncbi:hypothetical protein DFP72DRAFT_1002546 [Ephemerocybe angulata]|uniref:GAR domain-containing protein n=1 Tax=Ephemerocybe angulata TaxID=980116 RepID=A0A8H6ME03_9AGAR|nr:hypothetical protein DFP72DRAFT_1002546 [Tulosesus angulatus]